MKNVLYMSDYSDIGGGENSLLQIILFQLNQTDIKPFFLCLKKGDLCNLLSNNGIPVGIMNTKQRRGWICFLPIVNFFLVIKIIMYLKKNRIDCIHINTTGIFLANTFIIAKLLGIPLFLSCHGVWEKPYGLRCKILSPFLKRVFFVSDYVKKSSTFQQGITTYLPFISKTPNQSDLQELITKYKKNDTILCGVIGRYQPIKNQLMFVEMMDMFIAQNPKYKIHILLIGSTLFNKELDQYEQKVVLRINQSKFNNRYTLIPCVHNMECYYELLDLVIVPSLSETFSMVTLEAMAKGKMVLATKNGGPSEIIRDGYSGFLYDPTSVDDFLKKMTMALSFDEQIMINAMKRSRDFLPDVIVPRIDTEYFKA